MDRASEGPIESHLSPNGRKTLDTSRARMSALVSCYCEPAPRSRGSCQTTTKSLESRQPSKELPVLYDEGPCGNILLVIERLAVYSMLIIDFELSTYLANCVCFNIAPLVSVVRLR